MFALVKPFLLAVTIIIFLLYALGLIAFKKPTYACFNGKKYHFAKKTILADFGHVQLYSYPLMADCATDERYDPKTVFKCGEQTYCQRDSNEAEQRN